MRVRIKFISLFAALAAATVFAITPAKAQFSGCGAGVFGGGTIGSVSGFGPPIGISADGWAPGVNGECGWKFGSIYFGAGVDYSWQYGDLEKIGFKNDLTVYAKAGVVITNTSMIYLHGGKAWLQTSGPNVDAWKIGVGSETKLGATPLYLDLRYTYMIVDEADLGLPSSIDVTGHSVRVGLNLKFGPGMFGQKGPMFTNEDYSSQGCDPKTANCKKVQ